MGGGGARMAGGWSVKFLYTVFHEAVQRQLESGFARKCKVSLRFTHFGILSCHSGQGWNRKKALISQGLQYFTGLLRIVGWRPLRKHFELFIIKTDKHALTEAQRTQRNPGLKEFWDTAKSDLHF